MGVIWEVSFWYFFFLTCVIAGGAAWLSGRALALGWRTWRLTGRRPPLGSAALWRRLRPAGEATAPAWLAPELAADRRLLARQRQRAAAGADVGAPRPPASAPLRPEAWSHTFDDGWADVFERLDAGVRGVPVVRRHPFFDRRLVALLLGLESLPWCVDKLALRRAARHRLPPEVWRRPKTPLVAEPWPGTAEPLQDLWRSCLEAAPDLDDYLDRRVIDRLLREEDERRQWRQLAPALGFACWRARFIQG